MSNSLIMTNPPPLPTDLLAFTQHALTMPVIPIMPTVQPALASSVSGEPSGFLYAEFLKIKNLYPDKPCISDKEQSMSYVEFGRHIESLIAQIKNVMPTTEPTEIRPFTLKAKVCALIDLPKTRDLVAWQLALNACGICFLTLEHGSVARKLSAIESAKPRLIIEALDEGGELKTRLREIEMSDKNLSPQCAELDPPYQNYQTYPSDCDYIIFSSGSTGKPKKIMLSAPPVVEVVKSQARAIELAPGAHFLWLLNPAFDASLSDIYATLLSGAHLVVSDLRPSEIKKIAQTIAKHGITHCDVPPVVFSIWRKYQALQPALFRSLQHIVFGGEKASESECVLLSRHFFLYNAYGPSETTICSSLYSLGRDLQSHDARRIGAPLPGVRYKVVNDELHIGGEHCALGYDDELLNHKFYEEDDENASDQKPGDNQKGKKIIRWYKTGDKVSIDEQENYLYLGRLDRQFKHHGQLVCPEEIEVCAMRSGAAQARVEYVDEKIILFYAGDLYDPKKMIQYLPAWMIPNIERECERLEINHNWKIASMRKG